MGLNIHRVINKIDLPAADIDRAREEIDADLGLDRFEAIVEKLPPYVGQNRAVGFAST